MEGRRRVLGEDHPDTLTSINNLPECTIYVQWYLGLLFADAGSGSARAGAVVIPLPGGGDPPPGIGDDDDSDGVPNGADACPNTPPGFATTLFGCLEGDLDGDEDVDIEDLAAFLSLFGGACVEVEDPARGACGPRWRAGAGSRSTAAHV